MTERLESEAGHIEMKFPYFVNKTAPVSGVRSLLDYQATLIGEVKRGGATDLWVKVVVPVTSLCPCSKKISAYGAHNQRSHVTIKARISSHVWIEELIDFAEKEASCELFGILKRPDEKWVTERAYDNPKFVEDMVRDVAVRLNNDERIREYVVESENFESIHNHSAYALIERNKDAESSSSSASCLHSTVFRGERELAPDSADFLDYDLLPCSREMSERRNILLKRNWQLAEACSSSVELTFSTLVAPAAPAAPAARMVAVRLAPRT